MQQVAPHREEPLLDGNAHSVRYGEMIHDGSGQPEKLNHQEEADSETFVMGSDAAEFVNKVKDQVCVCVLSWLPGDPVLSRQYLTRRHIGARMTRG